jgi:PadR family transcriptional regulator PadR
MIGRGELPMNAPFFTNWTSQIRKGLLELMLLNDIGNRGTYAYEIEKTLCRSHGLLMGTGVVYKMLGRFTRQRLVKTTERKSPEGPKRKHYELTPLGRETLRQMNAYWDAISGQARAMTGEPS